MAHLRALAGNTVLQELSLASHAVPPAAAAAFAAALGTNRTLRSLDLGNSAFGDEVRSYCAVAMCMSGTELPIRAANLYLLWTWRRQCRGCAHAHAMPCHAMPVPC